MQWKGPIKEIQVELPADLHKAVKTKSSAEDIRLYEAYTLALEWYLGYEPKTPELPAFLCNLTDDELRFIKGLALMMGDRSISGTRRGLVGLLVNEVADYLNEKGTTDI